MAKFAINVCVIAILFTVFALSGSASDDEQKPEYGKHRNMISLTETNPTCRKLTELCTQYGDYSCCEGFACTGDPGNLPGGVGVCTPIGEAPAIPKTCQANLQICVTYGPYQCCNGLKCVSPGILPPIGGINFDKLNLPPGVGVCAGLLK